MKKRCVLAILTAMAVIIVLSGFAAAIGLVDLIKLWQDFIVGIAPCGTVIFLVLIFREPLTALIRSIRQIKVSGSDLDIMFDRATIGGEHILNQETKEKAGQDNDSLEAAIITAYAKIDTALRKKYAEIHGDPHYTLLAIDMLNYFWEQKKISTETLIVADSMRSLRENIFRAEVRKLSKEQLEAYKRNADQIAGTIRGIHA